MKFDKIVGFGDSWIYGDELVDPVLQAQFDDAHASWQQNTAYRQQHCFLGLLGKHYQVPVINFGIPGGSLQSAIWTFLWWLEHEPQPGTCLVLIGLTEGDRFSHYDPNHHQHGQNADWDKFVHSTWVEHGSSVVPEQFRDLCKRQIVLTACPELSQLNYLQALMLFDGVSARRHIPLLQFHIAPPHRPTEYRVPSLIWPKRNLCQWLQYHPRNQDLRYYKPDRHPNEQGHEIIRDLLISEIDRVILAQ